MTKMIITAVLILSSLGCADRNIGVHPDEVQKLNSTEWTIKSEPEPTEAGIPK